MSKITALITDDEPLLRQRLVSHLSRAWPALHVVAEARNARLSRCSRRTRRRSPSSTCTCRDKAAFDAARSMIGRTQIVFVTAYEQYAVQAFEQGAIDYLVKPFDESRLDRAVARLQERLTPARAADTVSMDLLLERLSAELRGRGPAPRHLQWIKASVGSTVRLIPVEQVLFMRSDEKYTLVVWDGGEALIRKTIRELADELDPERHVQIHRSVIVNLARVTHVTRGLNETAEVHLEGRTETLPVSRSFLHLFRQM